MLLRNSSWNSDGVGGECAVASGVFEGAVVKDEEDAGGGDGGKGASLVRGMDAAE